MFADEKLYTTKIICLVSNYLYFYVSVCLYESLSVAVFSESLFLFKYRLAATACVGLSSQQSNSFSKTTFKEEKTKAKIPEFKKRTEIYILSNVRFWNWQRKEFKF